MKNAVILALLITFATPFTGAPAWAQTSGKMGANMGKNMDPNVASSALPPQSFSPLVETGAGTVALAVDGLRLTLNDGQIVELSGIEIPGMNEMGAADPSNFPLQAKQALDQLFVKDKDIILYQTRDKDTGRVNRMGHTLAHVVQKPGNVWIQSYLVRQGLARVAPTLRNPELADQLYKIEQQARDEKRGIWADGSAYTVVKTADPINPSPRFIVAEGTVVKAAIVSNRVYLNFGDDWKKDFSVGVEPDVRRALARAGIDPLQLQGKALRIRGWVRDYNGPFIDLETPAQIEFPDGSKPLPAPGGAFTVEAPKKPETDTDQNANAGMDEDSQNDQQAPARSGPVRE